MQRSQPPRVRELIERHIDDLYRAAHRLVRNRHDAEDLVQETCIRACRQADALVAANEPKHWLYRVQYNVFLDGMRRRRRSPIRVTEGQDGFEQLAAGIEAEPEEQASREQHAILVERAWLRVKPSHRALLALRAEGYTSTEMEAITGLKKAVLNNRLQRARLSFAKHLSEFESERRRQLAEEN